MIFLKKPLELLSSGLIFCLILLPPLEPIRNVFKFGILCNLAPDPRLLRTGAEPAWISCVLCSGSAGDAGGTSQSVVLLTTDGPEEKRTSPQTNNGCQGQAFPHGRGPLVPFGLCFPAVSLESPLPKDTGNTLSGSHSQVLLDLTGSTAAQQPTSPSGHSSLGCFCISSVPSLAPEACEDTTVFSN